MTQNTQSTAGEDAGSGRHGERRRTRGWIVALALIGLGAIGGALTTVAVDADAHGGWRHGFRHHGHHRATDPAEVTERLHDMSAKVLGAVDATDEQRERIDAILASAVDDVFPLRAEHEAHRRDLIAGLVRPHVDRAELERVRVAELALADKATARLLDATVAIAEVLDPEQRQQLAERLAKRWHSGRRH